MSEQKTYTAKEMREIIAKNVAIAQAEIKAQYKDYKIVKYKSDIFVNNKDNSKYIYFKSLSETKKYVEVRHLEKLKAFAKQDYNKETLTSEEFHLLIAKRMFA